eukprot:scaffold145676_cov30-Tisochrysis_lutea.AAC.3
MDQVWTQVASWGFYFYFRRQGARAHMHRALHSWDKAIVRSFGQVTSSRRDMWCWAHLSSGCVAPCKSLYTNDGRSDIRHQE